MKNPCGRKSSLVIVTSTWSPWTARRTGPGLASGREGPPERADVEREGELRRLGGLREDEGEQGGPQENNEQQDRCAESSVGGRLPTHPKTQRLARHQG